MNLQEYGKNKMLDDFSLRILKLMRKREKSNELSTWYNIEMAIHPTPFTIRKKASVVLRELEVLGLIEKVNDSKPMEKWFITEQGKKYLQDLEDKENG